MVQIHFASVKGLECDKKQNVEKSHNEVTVVSAGSDNDSYKYTQKYRYLNYGIELVNRTDKMMI